MRSFYNSESRISSVDKYSQQRIGQRISLLRPRDQSRPEQLRQRALNRTGRTQCMCIDKLPSQWITNDTLLRHRIKRSLLGHAHIRQNFPVDHLVRGQISKVGSPVTGSNPNEPFIDRSDAKNPLSSAIPPGRNELNISLPSR